MEVAGLIQQSEVNGLLISEESEFHQKVAGELVLFEQNEIVKFIQKAVDLEMCLCISEVGYITEINQRVVIQPLALSFPPLP